MLGSAISLRCTAKNPNLVRSRGPSTYSGASNREVRGIQSLGQIYIVLESDAVLNVGPSPGVYRAVKTRIHRLIPGEVCHISYFGKEAVCVSVDIQQADALMNLSQQTLLLQVLLSRISWVLQIRRCSTSPCADRYARNSAVSHVRVPFQTSCGVLTVQHSLSLCLWPRLLRRSLCKQRR